MDINATLLGYIAGSADIADPTSFVVSYRLAGGTLNSAIETLTVNDFDVTLPSDGEPFVAGSVSFMFGDKVYVDRLGQLYHSINPVNGNGVFGGTFDYSTGKVNLQSWHIGDTNSGAVLSSLTTGAFNPVDRVVLRTPQAPLKPSSFAVRATLASGGFVSASSNDSGEIASAHIVGTIDNNTGIAILEFGSYITAAGQESQPWFDPAKVVNSKIFKPEPVLAETVIYNAVSYTFLPLDSSILGLDPARLPVDGRIPVYHKGDVVVIVNDQFTGLTATSNTTTDLGRVRLSRVIVKDLGGNLLASSKWSANLDTGIITWGDLSGVSQPLSITDRIQDEAVVADVQVNGKIVLSKPVTHNYPHTTTLVASAVIFGDMFAHASNPFDQQTWTGVWSDVLIGNQTTAQYNHTAYPLEVTNEGTIEERFLIVFVTSSTVNVIGEHIGQILTGVNISNDIAPVNPATNAPYFTLRHLGFGSGWSAGNCLRFNTYQAAKPVWVIQSVMQGDPTSDDYRFCLSFNGDVDVP
jgi:hypothetical protein